MKKILFLDFDGVMDTQRYCAECYRAGRLEYDRYDLDRAALHIIHHLNGEES